MEHNKVFVPRYKKADRDHMRQFLLKASPVIDLIAQNQVPWGSFLSVELADDADLTDSERNTENLRRALRKKPLE